MRNEQRTSKRISHIIKYYGDGGDVECRRKRVPNATWRIVDNDKEWLDDIEYRIAEPKPPKEIWVNCTNEVRGKVFTSKKQAEQSVDPWPHIGVRYRIDDDE